MKNIITTIFILCQLLLISGAMAINTPNKINYQGIARNANGEILTEQELGVQIQLRAKGAGGDVVYQELHKIKTNEFGVFTLQIGGGDAGADSFDNVEWGEFDIYVEIGIDFNGGSDYTSMGVTQLVAVPYAIHAQEADNVFSGNYNDLSNAPTNVSDFANDVNYITLTDLNDNSDTNEIQDLTFDGTTLTITNNQNATAIDLSPLVVNNSINTDEQTLSLAGTTLSISGGNDLDVSSLQDGFEANTDTQLTEAEVDDFVANNGYLTSYTEVDGDVTNEIQDLSLVGTTLSLSGDDTSVDLSQLAGANTDEQTLSLAGTTLSISGGNDLDVSSLQDGFEANTDTQLTEAEVDGFVANNGYLTSYTEVDGDVTNEIQDLSLVGSTLKITNNVGATEINLAPFSGTNTDEQSLTLTGNSLAISNGNSVDLSSIQDGFEANTDTQLTEAEVDGFVANNGYLTAEVDGDATNEIQDLSLTGNTLSLSDDNTTVDLSQYMDDTDTNLTEAEVDGFVANNGYLTAEVDGDATNEIQDLELVGSTLKITNNGSATAIDLSPFAGTNTDEQTLTLTGTSLAISNGNNVDLSAVQDGFEANTNTQLTEAEVDAFTSNNGYLSAEVDGSITNEIQDLELVGSTLKITNNGSATAIDLSPFAGTNTDEQTLTLTGTSLAISNGNNVDLSAVQDGFEANTNTQLTEAEVDAFIANNGYLTAEMDASVINEIQNLNLTGNDLTITKNSGATIIDLSPYMDDTNTQLTEAEVDVFVNNNGYLSSFTEVDGSITNEIQDLNLTGDNLKITNNGAASTIDLSPYMDNTNTQLTEAEVDAFVNNNGYLSSFTEVDGSITNEIQDLNLTGDNLKITNNGSASTIDLSPYMDNTNTQLTEAEVDAFANNNGYLSSFTEVDGSITNEIQDLSLSGTTLSLSSDGTTVNLSSFMDNTDTQSLSLSGSNLSISGVAGSIDISTASGATFGTVSSVTSNSGGTYTTNDFVFGSPQLADDGLTTHDRRFFFDKSKAAFRAGYTSNDSWDDANVGEFSFSGGNQTLASGQYSVSLGNRTNASGNYALATGNNTAASGLYSTALGTWTTASGESSTAIGERTIASGLYSFASGYESDATEQYASAMGYYTLASGVYATALGNYTVAQAQSSLAIGYYNVISGSTNSKVSTDPLFVIGNGTSSTRSNALTVLKNGNMGIGVVDPDTDLEINGQIKITGGVPGAGKVLTSDANGLASWATQTSASINSMSDGFTNGFDIFLGATNGGNTISGLSYNIGIGFNALDVVTTGASNIALGAQTLMLNETGVRNIAIGYGALDAITGTSDNVAIGGSSFGVSTGTKNVGLGVFSAQANVTGSSNVVIGYNADAENTSGSQNTIVGYQAGKTSGGNSKSGSVMIGYQAGTNETASNKLYIENSNSATPLIGGDFTTDEVTINGTLNITNVLHLTPLASAPASPLNGDMYYGTDDKLYIYVFDTWKALAFAP